MKKNKIIYWITTGIIGLMMVFSAVQYFTNLKVEEGFTHLGFPNYFRVELGLAKLIGALVLLIPQIPLRIKEWAYAGFGIVFISATIAHYMSGDAVAMVISPMVFLIILIISNIYLHKVNKA
ncbi:MAG TPA: DoxX family protein [Bacteroidia bacterium]|nr:DoxX family protein [Bacteroidia bacterium]